MADEELPYQTIRGDDGTVWVEITSVGTADEANLLQGFLEGAGVTAQIENLKFSMEPINFGTMGDIRIYVAQQDEQKAMDLLRRRNDEYDKLDDDTETVVTDEGPADIDDNAQVEPDTTEPS